MTPPNSPAGPALSIYALPKLAALAFLVLWGIEGREVPLDRLSFLFGAFAVMEAVSAAAARKQQVQLGWGDLGLVGGSLLAPGNLPVYALLAAGVMFFGEAAPGWRRPTVATPERTTTPSRTVSPARPPNAPGGTTPGAGVARPGTPGAPTVKFGPRPGLNTPPRPATPPPTGVIPSAPAAAPSPAPTQARPAPVTVPVPTANPAGSAKAPAPNN